MLLPSLAAVQMLLIMAVISHAAGGRLLLLLEGRHLQQGRRNSVGLLLLWPGESRSVACQPQERAKCVWGL